LPAELTSVAGLGDAVRAQYKTSLKPGPKAADTNEGTWCGQMALTTDYV
jgi:hypothetical protein